MMTALGQKRTWRPSAVMSAIPPNPGIDRWLSPLRALKLCQSFSWR
jgi:hypothetical protein